MYQGSQTHIITVIVFLHFRIIYLIPNTPSSKPKHPERHSNLITPSFILTPIKDRGSTIQPIKSTSVKSAGSVSVFHKAKIIKLIHAEQIKATTAGRRPFKIPRIGPISPYLKNSEDIIRTIITEGNTKPAVAATAPVYRQL